MTNADIVIPRAELPEASVIGGYVTAGAQSNYYASSAHADMTRTRAYALLAIAEKIDEVIAKQADKKLDEEALALFNSRHDRTGDWGYDGDHAKKNWRKVARAARELHGK